MNNIHDDFKAAAEEYAQRLRDDKERRNNPNSSTDNAQMFAEHLEAALKRDNTSSILDI